MPRYARIIGGYAIDVYDADSVATLEKRMGVTGFVEVPVETLNNSTVTLNPDGSVASVKPPLKIVDEATDQRASLSAKLRDLDRVTGPRWMEAWLKANGDDFVKKAIVEKEDARKKLAEIG